jgi:hypothetical protein
MGRDCTGTRIGILVLGRALCNDLPNGRTWIPAPRATGAGCGREYAGAGLHGRSGELRGPGIDDYVAVEQHAAASLRGMWERFRRSCRSRQLSMPRVMTYLARPRYGTKLCAE